MKKQIIESIRILEEGGIILYPTDTIWGLGCDASNWDAIKKIYDIKRRHEAKLFITLVSSPSMLKRYTSFITGIDITSRPTTVIYPKVSGIDKSLLSEDDSAAIRIVQDKFCKKLINRFDKAIVSTSANISGNQHPRRFSDICDTILERSDYIVNLRQNEEMRTPSSIIKIDTSGKIIKIR